MTKTNKILLVEDDSDILLILNKILVKAGYNVQAVTDGSAILENDFDCPDLFILDKSLPTIDGVALCKYLRLKERS